MNRSNLLPLVWLLALFALSACGSGRSGNNCQGDACDAIGDTHSDTDASGDVDVSIDMDATTDTDVSSDADASNNDMADGGDTADATDTGDMSDMCIPTGDEQCDDVDNNCNGTVDEGCNRDTDDYCTDAMTTVGMPMVCTAGGGDCNDMDAQIHPTAQDGCGVDWNCDMTSPPFELGTPNALLPAEEHVFGEDMAFDGTDFGAVWTQETPTHRILRFAKLDTSGAIVAGPIDLLGPTTPVYDASIGWSASRSAWVVAYTAPDPARGQWSVFLTYVDATNTASTPIYLAQSRASAPIKLLVGGDYANVFFTRRLASMTELYHVSTNTLNDVVSVPTQLLADSSLSVRNFSFAWHPGTNVAWVVRYDYRSGNPQSHGYEIVGVRGNGSVRLTATWFPFPGTALQRYPSLTVINGNLHMFWIDVTASPDALIMRQLSSSSGTTVGTQYTIATNVRDSSTTTYTVVDKGTRSVVVYQNDTIPFNWEIIEISNTTFATLAGPYMLWFDTLTSRHSVNVPLFVANDRTYLLDTTPFSPDHFNLYGINSNGTQSLDVQPIASAPATPSAWRDSVLVEYDETTDVFTWFQRDEVFTEYQVGSISGDGSTLVEPTAHSATPSECTRLSRGLDGTLVCMSQRRADCASDEEIVRREWDGTSWSPLVVAGSVPGNNCNDGLQILGYLGNGRTAALHFMQSFTMGLDLALNYVVFDAAGQIEFSTPMWSIANYPGSLQVLEVEFSETQVMVVAGIWDSAAGNGRLDATTVQTDTGVIGLPTTQLMPTTERWLKAKVQWNGETFAVAASTQSADLEWQSSHGWLVDPAGPVTQTSVSAPGAPTAVFGTPEHNIFLFENDAIMSIEVVDAAGTVIQSGPLDYQGVTPTSIIEAVAYTPTHGYRVLGEQPGRILQFAAECR